MATENKRKKMNATTYNAPVFNDYWNVIKDWNDEMKRDLFNRLKASMQKEQGGYGALAEYDSSTTTGQAYVSPLLKAVETGIDHSKGMSLNYKEELGERKEIG